MESKSIPQGNDLNERRSRRRLSSILKAPRSPLRDLGIGNELHQESTLEKRRKSSRRVSFAETIRVFTPELKSAEAGDADNGGVGTDCIFSNENESTDSKCNITGMDILLHGPLQAPAPQAEWNSTKSNKDQTIFFSCDHDMDLTASNTVAIDGLIEEKPKKIDTRLFLASLKAPTSTDSSSFDFKFSTAGEKLQDFQPSTTSSSQTKVKFGDFLARLESESASSSKVEGIDKENIFPFVSKENMFSTNPTLPIFYAEEHTGNVTRVFRDQEDVLDLTKCHTVNITSFIPTVNHQLTHLSSSSTHNKQEFGLSKEASVKPPKSVLTDRTVLCGDDMDMTLSHTIPIHGVCKENAPPDKTKLAAFNNEKTIIFSDENEMELTKNDFDFFNSTLKKGRQSIQRNRNPISGDQTIVCPEEDMDMTRSHTVAIDVPAICEMFKKAGDSVQPGKRPRGFGLLLPFQVASSVSESLENEQQGLAATPLNPLPLKSVREIGQNKLVIGDAESKCNRENVKFPNSCSISTVNAPLPSTERTVLFECEQDDMEMTKSHTIAIASNTHSVTSNTCIQNPVLNDKKLHIMGLRLSSGFNKTILFSGESDDMDLTQSHTVRIDQKTLKKNNLLNSTLNPILNATDQTKHLQDNMEMTAVEYDDLQVKSALAAAENKTVVFSCEQQDMDFTQSHTVAIDGGVWCKGIPLDTNNQEPNCVLTEERNMVLGSKIDSRNLAMQASVDDKITSLSHSNLGFSNSGQVYKTVQDNTNIFPSDQNDMELTKSHTIAIDSKMLSDSNRRHNSILKDRKSNGRIGLSAIHNKTVFFSTDGDDMELTQSHTVCINQNNLGRAKQKRISNAVDHTRHVLDDMEMTMVESASLQRGPNLNESKANKTVVFGCDQQDMDITRSHTVAIDGDTLSKGFQSDTGLAINKRADFISTVPRCLPGKNLVLEFKKDCGSVGKMDSGDTLVPLSNLASAKQKRFSNAVDHTRHVLDDDMEMTMVESASLQRGPNLNESKANKTVVFACDQQDMDITRSHTVAIDGDTLSKGFKSDTGLAINNRADFISTVPRCLPGKNLVLESKKDCGSAGKMDSVKGNALVPLSNLASAKQKRISNAIDHTRHVLDDMEMTMVESASLQRGPNLNESKANKTVVFACDQQDMDITRSHTVAIDGDALSKRFQSDTGLAINERADFISTVPRCMPDKNLVLESKKDCGSVSKMDSVQMDTMVPLSKPEFRSLGSCTNINMPGPKSTGQLQSMLKGNSLVVLPNQDMDLTRANTVTIKRFLLPDGSANIRAITHAPCPDKTVVFEDDMEYTKSHTALIDGVNTNELPSQSVSMKSMAFSADDMDMTNSNTVFIDNAVTVERAEAIQQHKNTFIKLSGPCNRILDDLKMTTAFAKQPITDQAEDVGNIVAMSAVFKNKTFNSLDQEDMDLIRANTIAIENKVFGKVQELLIDQVQQCDSPADLKKADMDITKSNTMFINPIPANKMPQHSMMKPKDVLLSQKPTGLHDGMELVAGQNELKNISGGELTNNARAQNSDLGMTINHDDKATFAVSNKQIDVSDCQIRHTVLPDEENLVEPPSKLYFVNNLPCKQVALDLSRPNNIFTGTSKRNGTPFHQKSFSTSDKTVHQVCNMEETTVNIDLVIGDAKHSNKGFCDQTVCNQGEMEITKCHTTAIESKIIGTSPSKCPAESDAPINKALSPFSKDISDKLTVNAEVLKNDKDIFIRNQGTHQTHIDECVLQCEYESMKINEAHTAGLESNSTEENCNEHLNAKSGDIQAVKFAEMSDILSGKQTFENSLKQPMLSTEKKESKPNDFSISLSSKTVMFSEDFGGMELTQVDTMAIHGLPKPGKQANSAGAEKTCLFLGAEMDVTKSNTVFIDQEFKVDLGSFSNEIRRPSNLVSLLADDCEGTVSDHKDANTKSDTALDNKYFIPNGNELTDYKALPVDREIIPLGVQTACAHKPINAFSPISDLCVASEPSVSCASQEQKTEADYICSQQSEACVPQIPGAVQDYQVPKKHRLSKRVSFCVPENDRVRESVAGPNTEITLQNREKLFIVPNYQSDTSQFEPGNLNEQTGGISVKFDFTDKVSIGCLLENNQDLNNSVAVKNVSTSDKRVSEEVANNAHEDVSSIKLFQKEKSRRRSIADIQLKIKSLTGKSKNRTSNPTAPVSCPTNELSTQTLNSIGGDCIPEQSLLKEQVPFKDTQANENEAKGKETTKEICLQNRLSVNILQPKLPSKRHFSTCNLQEFAPFTNSKPPTQTARTSLSLLKEFTDGDGGQCIEEEMLPACPDDHDGNGLFQFEVPEGAWEELCEKEALHENLNDSKETVNSNKRARETEDDTTFHSRKRVRRNDETQNTQTSVGPDECSKSDYSSHHTSKNMEQTYYSSSSQDSRGEGMSVELSSQQYSQMDSQLPWDNGCGQSLWQKFQDGTITVKEFFMLLRIRILIQKPRYSELPVNRGNFETLSSADLMLDLFVFQPKLQVYEEECYTLYQTTEELKLYTDMQEKPLIEVSSLLWEAMRMCSEDELMCFGMTLKNLKSVYSKKSKIFAHEAKVSIYSKLLHKAQVQVIEVQRRITETDKLLEEIDDCISSLEIENANLEEGFKNNWINIPGGKEMQCELENLSSRELIAIRERSHLETQKEKVLTHLGCLQDEARSLEKHLQEPCFAEWDMVEWTNEKSAFIFLYDSLELTIMFGDEIDGKMFDNQPCRRISRVILMSQLNEEVAPPSTLLVHRLILQFIEKKGNLHETYKTQKDVPQLLFDVSLVVSRCKLLGEEVEYLMKWGAKYNIVKTKVESNEVKLLFSSSAAFAKFELSIQISEKYLEDPLSFTVLNRIGNIEYSRVAAVISKVPMGLWLLKRIVRRIHEHLLV